MNRKDILASIEAKQTELEGLLAKETLSVEELAQVKSLNAELETLDTQLAECDEQDAIRQKAAARKAKLQTVANPLPSPEPNAVMTKAGDSGIQAVYAVPVRGRCRKITEKHGRRDIQPEEKAYRFGMWLHAALGGGSKARAWCDGQGIDYKTMVEGLNERGGALVPEEFEAMLIDLRESYGVFRRYARVEPMTRDTKRIPRRTGGVTAYPIGEGSSITASDAAFDTVLLTAHKWGALTKISSELGEDAVIDLGDRVAGEIAYAFGNKEDECGFNGDGTSTYHGITGVRQALKGLSGTIANIAGLFVGSGNLYSELLLTDFQAVVGKLPAYADTPNTAWFCHKTFYETVMQKFKLAAGGVTAAEIIGGARQQSFLGYPVVFSQVMPATEANSQVCAIFGDLSLGAAFGDRRETTLALSEHSDFASDLIAIRGTERFDVVVHDVGNASATASARVPGPIVGLITAAS